MWRKKILPTGDDNKGFRSSYISVFYQKNEIAKTKFFHDKNMVQIQNISTVCTDNR